MVILLDVGNTNIKVGVLMGERIAYTWRIATDYVKTADEYGTIFYDLLRTRGMKFEDVEGIIMSSVVPSVNYTIEHMCRYYMKKRPITVNHTIDLGIQLDYANPAELGADRIVNAVAAYTLYGGPCITVDFGTATTFGAVNGDGVFLGGAIAPGIKSGAEAMTTAAAKLPRIELVQPESVIGKTTIKNMQSGLIYGFTGLVEGILTRMKAEKGMENALVVATGGMSELVTGTGSGAIDKVNRALSLEGLKILYRRNCKKEN